MLSILFAALFLLLGLAWGAVLNWFAGSVNEEGELRLKAPACPKCGNNMEIAIIGIQKPNK